MIRGKNKEVDMIPKQKTKGMQIFPFENVSIRQKLFGKSVSYFVNVYNFYFLTNFHHLI